MDKPFFSISEAIQEGWRLTKANLGFLIGYQIILFLLAVIFSAGQGMRWTPWHIIGWIIVVLAKMGLYQSTLLITAGIKPSFDQLYKNWRLFISWVVANFLFGIAFVIGLILLIVPGCYIWARYGFFPFFILDKNLGPLKALELTGVSTEGVRWDIFLLFVACLLLNLLGLLLLGIGLLFTIPTTLLALASVYRKISARVQTIDYEKF